MNLSQKSQIILSQILLFFLIWVSIGAILFPDWWYLFIFSAGFLDPKFLFWGMNTVTEYLFFRNPGLLTLLFVCIIYLYVASRKNLPKLPEINLFKPKSGFFILIFSTIVALLIYSSSAPLRSYSDRVAALDIDTAIRESARDSVVTRFNPPIDFLFLDDERINGLYSQIEPDFIPEGREIESGEERNRQLEGGNELIRGNTSEKQDVRSTDKYDAKELTSQTKAISLLNHYSRRSQLEEIRTLELSSEEIRKLDEFKTISQSYSVGYDKEKYDEVYSSVIKRVIVGQIDSLKNLNSQLLVVGSFNVDRKDGNLNLSHDYFNKGSVRISFALNPISEKSASVKAESLKDPSINGKSISIEVFARVVRNEILPEEKGIIIHCEPYAIW